jgi:predicted glutamine amidotransferase
LCGLVGFAGFLEYKHKNAMKELLFLDTLRGKDSTGLAAVDRDRRVSTRKFTVPGYEFIEYPAVERAMCHADQLWIGHNRFKTSGNISKANAHPFEVLDEDGDILLVGAHNGTLINKYELDHLVGDKFDTDSETLFNWLVEAPDFKEAISKVKGAWSLTWWDPTTDSLHFLRNEERPLTYAFTKDHKAVVWASEAWMIINACRRNGVELARNDKGLSCFSTVENTLYTLPIPQERDKALPDFTREGGYTGAPVTNFPQYRHHGSWWSDENWKEEPNKDAKGAEETKTTGTTDERKVVTLGLPRYKGFQGKQLDAKELRKVLDRGCVWCKDKFEKNAGFGFLEEDAAVCHKCLNDLHPKDGDRVRRDDDPYYDELDDDLPFDLDERPGGVFVDGTFVQKDSPEYRRLIDAAVTGSIAQTVD